MKFANTSWQFLQETPTSHLLQPHIASTAILLPFLCTSIIPLSNLKLSKFLPLRHIPINCNSSNGLNKSRKVVELTFFTHPQTAINRQRHRSQIVFKKTFEIQTKDHHYLHYNHVATVLQLSSVQIIINLSLVALHHF